MKPNSEESVPRLRTDIEFLPASYQGTRALLVKDSLGLIQKPIVLKGEILEFLSLIDGKKDVRDFQLELMRRKGGIFVSSEEVEGVLQELDSAFLLDNERYRQEKERILAEYSLLEVRKASHAGHSYPENTAELRSYMGSFFSQEEGDSQQIKGKEVVALISPHIDLEVGKRIYKRAYHVIRNSSPKRVFLLGTGHSLHESYISLTEKDFETPLGLVKTDKDFVKVLKEAGEKVVSHDDIAHRKEHSIEFQLIFLQSLFGSDFSLVPILCGSFHKVLEQFSRPLDIPGMGNFLEALKLSWAEDGPETLIIAGVDFSHIGPKFGHNQHALSMLTETKSHDELLIEAICNKDVKSFWAESQGTKGRFNVCGFSAIACLLEILDSSQGHLLDYDIWQEEPTQSAVSFAAIVFETE